jgi:hypothetical protein
MNIRRRSDLGLAPRTLDAYYRGLAEYLMLCAAASTDPLTAGRDHIARHVRELTQRPPWRASADTAPSSAAGPRLANATVQQRLTAVRTLGDTVTMTLNWDYLAGTALCAALLIAQIGLAHSTRGSTGQPL